jgi:hypothetical protein
MDFSWELRADVWSQNIQNVKWAYATQVMECNMMRGAAQTSNYSECRGQNSTGHRLLNITNYGYSSVPGFPIFYSVF